MTVCHIPICLLAVCSVKEKGIDFILVVVCYAARKSLVCYKGFNTILSLSVAVYDVCDKR